MSDSDWKKGLTEEQLEKVTYLELCLSNASDSMLQKHQHHTARGLQLDDNNAVSLAETVPPIILCSSPSSPPPLPTCPPPSSPSASLLPFPSPNPDTSPSLRSLNPGYVSSLAEFWANRWKKENTDLSNPGHNEHGCDGMGGNDELTENSHELNHLRESLMLQCELLKAIEEENLMLKADLTQKIEVLTTNENTITDLKSSLKECNDKLSSMNKECLVKNQRLAGLEENLLKVTQEKEVLEEKCQSMNLLEDPEDPKIKGVKICKKESRYIKGMEEMWESKFERMEQNLVDKNSKVIELKSKNSQLLTELSQYEETVKDLRNQIIPKENLKVKMESLDQDVKILRSRLQNSIRRSKNATVENTFDVTTKPGNKSVKRRWIMEDQDVTSPAKMIKLAETTFSHNPPKHKASGSKNSTNSIRLPLQRDSGAGASEVEHVSFSGSLKRKGKFGRQVEECKQQ